MAISGIVRELMVPLADYPHVNKNASVRDVFATLRGSSGAAENFRNILVLDEKNQMVGMLGLKDLLHALLPDYLQQGAMHYEGTTQDVGALALLWQEDCADHCRQANKILARDHVSRATATIGADEPLAKAAFLFATTPVNILPVTENNRLVGVVRLVDVFDQVVGVALDKE